MNKFLFRHPNIGALCFCGALAGVVVLGGMAIDFITGNGIAFVVVVVFSIVCLRMILAGNRHLS